MELVGRPGTTIPAEHRWLVPAPEVERLALDDRSWIDVVRGILPAADQVRDELLATVAWQQGRVFRYERYVDEPRLGAMQRGAERHPALVEVQRVHQPPLQGDVRLVGARLVPRRARRRRLAPRPRDEVARRHGHRGAHARTAAPVPGEAGRREPAQRPGRSARRSARPLTRERRPARHGRPLPSATGCTRCRRSASGCGRG